MIRNHASGSGGGGFLFSENMNVLIKNCDFYENTAVNFYGGGLYVYSQNYFELSFVQFI